MPYFGFGIHFLIALYFAIHALRHKQEMYWLIVLFSFPLLGSIAYFVVVYLPGMRESRGARIAKRAVVNVIDPGRELREANRAYDLTPTINNRLRLADALLASGDITAALQHYTESAQGPFAGDSLVMRGLARCLQAAGRPQEAVATLEKLFANDKDARRHPDAALTYACALGEVGTQGVREAFEIALVEGTDAEPKCRYADWLMKQGTPADIEQAHGLYRQIIKDSGHWHKHARNHNAEWFKRARSVVGG